MISHRRKIVNLLIPFAIWALIMFVPKWCSTFHRANRYKTVPLQGEVDSEGKRQGEWATEDASGNLHVVENYLDGELNGPRKTYYSNESLELKENFHKGVKIGVSTRYHGNGLVNCREFFDSTGIQNGPFEIYDETGKLIQHGIFNHGVIDTLSHIQ